MTAPALEGRFLKPPQWQWGSFTREGLTIRYGYIAPENPDAVAVCLPGLSEFAEKYFETARDCLDQNVAFYVLDWFGQGKSGRYFTDSQKRHSQGYQHDINDLSVWIRDVVRPAAKGKPIVMLAHSMGAHIGLRYLAQHPGLFTCAMFSAPMIGVKAFEHVNNMIAKIITGFSVYLSEDSYIAGFGDWRESVRATPEKNFFSGDEIRNAVHNAWCLADPELQVGGITYAWLHESHKSCMELQKEGILESINIPCIIALAGKEHFVDNNAIRKAASILPNAKLIEFPDSRHEILMESDTIRKVFLGAFYDLIKKTKQGKISARS